MKEELDAKEFDQSLDLILPEHVHQSQDMNVLSHFHQNGSP